MLHIKELTYRIGSRLIFDDASAHVPKGHKVGLVGVNGSGKTTLFKLIEGQEFPDGGKINVSEKCRLGIVSQEAPSGDTSLIETVINADLELSQLEDEATKAVSAKEISDLQLRLTDIGAHNAKARAATILAGLGFDENAQKLPCNSFSGGWRMRVAIAATLFSRPDLLLLDEPTNHLDLEASLWLENYLANFSGTLVIISHDRDLLNRSVGNILFLDNQKLTSFSGNYDRFERTQNEHISRLSALRQKQSKERDRIKVFVDRFRAKATKARQAQSRLKKLARMEEIEETSNIAQIRFHFPNGETLAPPLLTMTSVATGYDGADVLKNLNLRLDQGDRIALLGSNGNGKSTLIKLIAGKIGTTAGSLWRTSGLRIGYFSQHQTDELNLDETPYTMVAQRMFEEKESKVRAQLGQFGFSGERSEVLIGQLSGGEKARLLFCLISLEKPNIILLDEPTNHLDIESRKALSHALNEYEGAVVLVSHDMHILELVADHLWLVSNGSCHPFDGDLTEYRQLMLSSRYNNSSSEKKIKASSDKRINKKFERKKRAEGRKNTTILRSAVKNAEGRLQLAENKVSELEGELAKPEVYAGATSGMLELVNQLSVAKEDLKKAEIKWIKADELLASALKRS